MQEQNTHLCKSDVLTNFAGILVLGHLVHQALSLHIVVRERKDPPANTVGQGRAQQVKLDSP